MKLNERVLANALASFTGALYLVCGFLVAIAGPGFMELIYPKTGREELFREIFSLV